VCQTEFEQAMVGEEVGKADQNGVPRPTSAKPSYPYNSKNTSQGSKSPDLVCHLRLLAIALVIWTSV
jgi:hypothetical protein